MQLRLGPQAQAVFSLRHWDGDVFVFAPYNDAAGPGSLSKADFSNGQLVLEHFNSAKSATEGLGIFARVSTGTGDSGMSP